jgi:hypothetical protein
MRFAWLRENAADAGTAQQAATHPLALIRSGYNLAFWVFLLPFFTRMQYGTGFVLFSVIIFTRLLANLYANRAFEQPEQYERFPFRIP